MRWWPFSRKEPHVCSTPGIELRLMLDGRPVLQGDSAGLHYGAKWGRKTEDGWHDLLNEEGVIQFKPKEGSVIGLEIRPIEMRHRDGVYE